MSLAFHLMAHAQPAQLARVLAALWQPENLYVIHYDRRRPASEHAAIARLAAQRDNILIQPPRPVLWGRYSLFRAQLDGLRLALTSSHRWTHWINASGQCYPLVPPGELAAELAAHRGQSFVRHFTPLAGGDWQQPERRLMFRYLDSPWIEWWFHRPMLGKPVRRLLGGGMIPRLPGIRRRLPGGFTWRGGDNWVVLSREACTYLDQSGRAAEIRRRLRRTALPEESLFQTILLDSPLAESVVNEHRRAINWQGGGSPKTFTEADWPRLEAARARGCWLARKFDRTRSSSLLDRIDQEWLVPA